MLIERGYKRGHSWVVNCGWRGWRGGRAGLINGGILGGPPVLVGPGELLGCLNLANAMFGQLQKISGFRLLYKNGSGWISHL